MTDLKKLVYILIGMLLEILLPVIKNWKLLPIVIYNQGLKTTLKRVI
jgi:hypothetical protein